MLSIATALAILWAFFLAMMIPQGIADLVFHPIDQALRTAHGEREGKVFAGRIGGEAGLAARRAILIASGPLVLTNLIWGFLVFRLTRQRPRPGTGPAV